MEPTASVHVVVERKIPAPARDRKANPQQFIFSVFTKFRKVNTSFDKSNSLSLCLSIHIGQLGPSEQGFIKFYTNIFRKSVEKFDFP